MQTSGSIILVVNLFKVRTRIRAYLILLSRFAKIFGGKAKKIFPPFFFFFVFSSSPLLSAGSDIGRCPLGAGAVLSPREDVVISYRPLSLYHVQRGYKRQRSARYVKKCLGWHFECRTRRVPTLRNSTTHRTLAGVAPCGVFILAVYIVSRCGVSVWLLGGVLCARFL